MPSTGESRTAPNARRQRTSRALRETRSRVVPEGRGSFAGERQLQSELDQDTDERRGSERHRERRVSGVHAMTTSTGTATA